jgi:hypothetical protein
MGSAAPPKRHYRRRHLNICYGLSADTTKQAINNNLEIVKQFAKPLKFGYVIKLSLHCFETSTHILYIIQHGGFERSDSSYRRYSPFQVPQLLMI